jgi:hypothetical protein
MHGICAFVRDIEENVAAIAPQLLNKRQHLVDRSPFITTPQL